MRNKSYKVLRASEMRVESEAKKQPGGPRKKSRVAGRGGGRMRRTLGADSRSWALVMRGGSVSGSGADDDEAEALARAHAQAASSSAAVEASSQRAFASVLRRSAASSRTASRWPRSAVAPAVSPVSSAAGPRSRGDARHSYIFHQENLVSRSLISLNP